jgi:hypothetical protein
MKRVLSLLLAAGALGALGASCSSEAPLALPDGCQPLEGDLSCTLPFPSDFFRQNGVVALSGAGKPVTATGLDADVVSPLAADGFSRQPAIVCALPDAVVADGLQNVVDDPTPSLDAATSPTLLVRADTGETVAHYVTLDPNPDDATHVPITIRPLAPLAPGVRYVVALRGVRNARGGLAAPAEGFRRIRDQDLSHDPALAPLAARYETDVFPVLASLGVDRGSLQLAWDFTTESKAWPESDMLDLRALVQAWLAQNTPKVTITSVDPGTAEYWEVLKGTITVPLYLDQPGPGGRLFRGSDGKIAQNGTTDVPFVIDVPTTVRDQFDPGLALAFGHGFFGNTDETDGQAARTLLSTLHAVTFAIDWWGMSKDDLGTVIGLLSSSPADLHTFVERVYQAMANWMVTTRAIETAFASAPELHRPASGPGVVQGPNNTTNAGALVYDASRVVYFGASMGALLGGTMTALDPDVDRAVLNVGGASWETIMPWSSAFAGLQFFIHSAMQTELGTQLYAAMLATALDRIDPATYAPYLIGSGLAGNPDRQMLLQIGVGDQSVGNPSSFFYARALGLSMVQPSPETAWGVPLADASSLRSALTVWDFGISPDVYRVASPPADNAVHNGVRNVPTAMQQMADFYAPSGSVTDPCSGPCTGP